MPIENQLDMPENIAAKEELLRQQVEATKGLVGSSDALDWSKLHARDAVLPDYRPIYDDK